MWQIYRSHIWLRARKIWWWVECQLRTAFHRRVWKRIFQVVGLLSLVAVLGIGFILLALYLDRTPASGSVLSSGQVTWGRLLSILANNVASGLFSAFVAVLLIESLREWTEKRERQRSLIELMRSDPERDNTNEIEELALRGWLYSYALAGAELSGVNFRGKNLQGAALPFAQMRAANFSNTNLSKADMRCAILRDCVFEGAILVNSDLRGCDLVRVDTARLKRAGAILDDDEVVKLITDRQ